MTTVIDQSSDKNHVDFYRFAQLYQLPEYVKSASLEDTGLYDPLAEPQKLSITCYADVRAPYQFPVHTKAASYVSWLYFLNNRDKIPSKVANYIQSRLEKAAAYWEMSNEVAKIVRKHVELNKTAEAPDSCYALITVDSEGNKHREFPLRNALEVKAAAAWFCEHRDRYDFVHRQKIAKTILDKAAAYCAAIGEYDDTLQKQAGLGFCKPKQAADLVRSRIYATQADQHMRDSFSKLASKIEHSPDLAMDHDTLSNLANTIDQFDRAWNTKYSFAKPRPEDVLFQTTYKEAADITSRSVPMVTGNVYDRDDLEKISLSDFRDLFGDELSKAVSSGLKLDTRKLAEVAPTFPRDDAHMFEQLARDSGVNPMAKQASARYKSYDDELIKSLAEFYGNTQN